MDCSPHRCLSRFAPPHECHAQQRPLDVIESHTGLPALERPTRAPGPYDCLHPSRDHDEPQTLTHQERVLNERECRFGMMKNMNGAGSTEVHTRATGSTRRWKRHTGTSMRTGSQRQGGQDLLARRLSCRPCLGA